jgi:Branched-chain amino acid transport system / permease component.
VKTKTNKLENSIFGSVKEFFRVNVGIIIAFGILFVVMSLIAENFFTVSNFINVLRTVSTNAFLAIGVMLSLMLGGIDLTGGALIALSGCISVALIQRFEASIPVAIVVSLFVGIIVGFLNGFIISYTGIHPFIVTLAMQSVCRGAAFLIAGGKPITIMNDQYTEIGNGFLGPLPLPVVYVMFFVFLTYILLNKTKTGRNIYAVGGNPIAAKYSGINIKAIQIIVWTISGFLAACGGIVLSARMSSGQPSVGLGFETDAIAAAVVGGTSMYGGVGSVGGMVIGVLIIGIISNGLNLLRVNSYWQYVAKGLIILMAVYIDMQRNKKKNRA